MAIIAVTNINPKDPKLKVSQVVKLLVRAVKGTFKVVDVKIEKIGKVCYVKLSESLNPLQVIEDIKQKTKFRAYVPDEAPTSTMKASVGSKLRKTFGNSPAQIFSFAHQELLQEMQSKYTGLFNLSKKTGHKLMDNISRTVFERLTSIKDSNPEVLENSFKLTAAYRRLHPHFGDFQLILSTLHRLQDEAGAPRTDLSERSLLAVTAQPCVLENIPLNKLQSACDKYSEKITKKIKEHIDQLEVETKPGDDEETTARKNVYEQLHNLRPYLSQIIRQVITNHFLPDKAPFHKVRMYGEPFLPRKAMLAGVMRRFQPVHLVRSSRCYNLLRFSVPLHQYAGLMALDNTEQGGAKLVIRSSNIPLYVIPKEMRKEIWGLFGASPEDEIGAQPEEVDDQGQEADEIGEDWITMSEG